MKKKCLIPFLLLMFQFIAVSAQVKIKVKNSWKNLAGKQGYYSWTIYLDEAPAVLNSIKYVEYLLHPTFKYPLQKVENLQRNPGFSYTATGWGEFNVKVKVVFKDPSKKPVLIDYWLKLGR